FAAMGLAAPGTWSELLQQAQIFKAGDLIDSGFVTALSPNADFVASHWNQIFWSSGGQLWEAEKYQVEGILNTQIGIEALEFANQLWQTAPVGAGAFGIDEVINAICEGTTAMAEI